MQVYIFTKICVLFYQFLSIEKASNPNTNLPHLRMYALALFTIVITCKLTVRANHSWVVNQHLCVLNLESEGILDYFTCLIRLHWTKNKMTNDFIFFIFSSEIMAQFVDWVWFWSIMWSLILSVWLRQNVHYYCIDKWLFKVFSSDVGSSEVGVI